MLIHRRTLMPIASSMTAYITSNFITGDSLEENVRIEATIVGVREHDFDGDVKPTIDLEDGRRIPLNQGRLKALIAAFGPNPANLIGRTIVVSRGTTTYAGKRVACVVVEPVVPTRIAADPKPAIAAQPVRKGSAVVESDRSVGNKAPREQAPPVQSEAEYGGFDRDDEIPF
jgi:hypothetical protein